MITLLVKTDDFRGDHAADIEFIYQAADETTVKELQDLVNNKNYDSMKILRTQAPAASKKGGEG